MGWRTAIELLACVAGLMAALAIGWVSAWAYPLGRDNIWLLTYISMGVVLLLNINQIRRAWIADRAKRRARLEGTANA